MDISRLAIFLSAIAISISAYPQTDASDSIDASVELQEVVIQAPKVVRKADMDVYYPSQSAVDNSKNGVQLLKNLMIPSVNVNEAIGDITTTGQTVQVRINGRAASVLQVKELLPETIKRVEWIDNPGLRYNGAVAVLNFVVVNPTVGGSLMAEAMPALNTAWGICMGSLKLNSGRSQWGASANFKNTNHVGSHRDYTETFTRPDGSSVTRVETPISGYLSNSFGSVQLDYSYIKPDTTVLWVAVHGLKDWPDASLYNSLMTLSDGSPDIRLRDYSARDGFTPSMRAYFEQHFSRNQVVAIDFNGSLYNGKTARSYIERQAETLATITDVSSLIKDRNQAFGITADYIKSWSKSRLTLGASYSANRNRAIYENLGGSVFHQRQDKAYFYGEYFQSLGIFTVTAGIGAQYTAFKFKETGQGNDVWNLRPQATFTYRHGGVSSFNLSFSTWQSAPTLEQTNVVEQQIDAFQWQKGNPDLKTSSSYMISARYNFSLPRVYGQFGARAFTSPNAITHYYYWDSGKLYRSFENSKGLSNLTFWFSPQIEVVPQWLSVRGVLQYRVEQMKGYGYELYNHNWCGDITAMLTYRGIEFDIQYRKAQVDLWGESLKWGESMSIAQLQYNWKDWQFGFGVLCPFTKYDQGSKSLNKWNSNEKHMRIDMAPMPFVEITYNLKWGHQKSGVRKIVNANAEIDQSSAAGR